MNGLVLNQMNHVIKFILDTLIIKSNSCEINAVSIWGALRGLETFSQLVYTDDNILVCFIFKLIYLFKIRIVFN
jgi:hypothetical protein